MIDTKYPDIEVKLTGEDGNAFFIIGQVKKALRRGGVSEIEISEFIYKCQSGDYDNVLRTCMEWVTVT